MDRLLNAEINISMIKNHNYANQNKPQMPIINVSPVQVVQMDQKDKCPVKEQSIKTVKTIKITTKKTQKKSKPPIQNKYTKPKKKAKITR